MDTKKVAFIVEEDITVRSRYVATVPKEADEDKVFEALQEGEYGGDVILSDWCFEEQVSDALYGSDVDLSTVQALTFSTNEREGEGGECQGG